jgi:hypothetical protein
MRTEMTCSTRIKRCFFGLACLTIAPLLAQTAQATELVARHTSADSSELRQDRARAILLLLAMPKLGWRGARMGG